MIFIAAACLLAVSGVTAALAPLVSNAVGCCIRRADNGREESDDALDESPPNQTLVVQASPGRHAISIMDNNSNINTDLPSLFIMLRLHVGWQVVRLDPFDEAVRLYNCWACVRSPPDDRTSLPVSSERILLWQSGAVPSTCSSNEHGRDGGDVGQLPTPEARAAAVAFTAVTAASAGTDGDRALPDWGDGGQRPTAIGMAEVTMWPPALSLGPSSAPALPPAAAHRPATTTLDIRPCASPPSPGWHPPAAVLRERHMTRKGSTSPRTRGGRPISPRQVPVSPPCSPSSPRSSKSVSTSTRGASSSSSSTAATHHHRSSTAGAPRSEQESGLLKSPSTFQDSSAKQTPLNMYNTSVSTTPPLTPASALSSPASTTSGASGSNSSRDFFGVSYGWNTGDSGGFKGDGVLDHSLQPLGDADGVSMNKMAEDDIVRFQQHDGGTRRSLQEQRNLQGILGPRTTTPEKDIHVRPDRERGWEAVAVAPRSEGSGQARTSGVVDPGTGVFDAIVKGVKPGQLRRLLIRSLRQSRWGGLGDTCAQVRMATMSLVGSEESNSVKGALEEVEILGSGSFGVVAAVRHNTLGHKFALKKLKEGAGEVGRYCAKAEMLAMARLAAASPHSNVVSAVCIDDREEAVDTMPILFPRADMDFGQVLWHGGWNMPAKLRCLEQIASGVRHVHEQGIGHGDIKPENMLLFDDGHGGCDPKLCDFGMSRALGELRPSMMGTPGYMPLEIMLASVATHQSQDTFAMAAVALVVCVALEKAQSNIFTSPILYTEEEAREIKALEAWGEEDPLVEARRQIFQERMMKRTMRDGSIAKLMTADNLHPDLGSSDAMDMVSLCLLPFLDENPDIRPDLLSFQRVMESLAADACR